jgi:hypothetical protein
MEQRKGTLIIVGAFAVVVGIEVLVHWVLASRPPGSALRNMYLSSSKMNSITMLVDAVAPSIALGLINGWIGYQWPLKRLCITTFLLAVGILGSQPLYRLFFEQEHLWWWPPTVTDIIFWLIPTLIFLSCFTYQGRVFRAWNAAGRPRIGGS